MRLTTILIADDHDLVRESISRMLEEVYGYDVVGQASSGEEAIKLAKKLQPDIVIMDVKMPGIGGMEATKRISRESVGTKVIALTGVANELFASQLMQAGASAYVTKGAGFEEIVTAIKAVCNGEKYLSASIAQQIVLRRFNDPDKGGSPFEKLSERELQTAILISGGSNVQSIAEIFSISPKTVNSYRYRIFSKLKLKSDVDIALLAVKHNLLGDSQEE